MQIGKHDDSDRQPLSADHPVIYKKNRYTLCLHVF